MNEAHFESSEFSEQDLPLSENNRAENDRNENTDSNPVDLSSNNLILRQDSEESEKRVPSSYLPETPISETPISELPISEQPKSESDENVTVLTPEIFASGIIPTGTMLGHFMINSFIGGGGMGRVYLATDTALDRKVAVKVLPRQRANDLGTVARFMNEAKSAARLNHEHIAQVYFAGEQSGIPYIAFEYVEGTNVRSMVEEYDAFPLPQALNYLIQISHALSHAADHGVVHRDVKPSNILITREGRAKLIDMGLARLLDPSESKEDLTASGVTLGTFDYISPEQARDPRNADIRSDIYSLGCTFFFMLSGRPPFPEGTVLQKLLQHQGDEPPDIRVFQPNIPAEVALLIQKMMAKDPRQRFQTPAALIESLVNVAKMLGLQPTGPGKLIWVMTPPSRTSLLLKHVPWLAAVTCLIVAVILLSLYSSERLGKLEVPNIPEVTTETINVQHPASPETGNTASILLPKIPPVKETQTLRENRFPFNATFYSPAVHHSANLLFSATINLDSFSGGLRPAFLPINGQITGSNEETKIPGGILNVLEIRKSFNTAEKPILSFTESESPLPKQRCVDPSGETPGSYPSLGVALADAEKQTVIELKWNNYMKVDPLIFAGQQLKIVAAKGYHPILFFESSESPYVSQNPRSMFTVGSSELEFSDLAIEMRIRQGVLAQDWSLFELIGGNKLTFLRCCLTIRNKAISDNSAYHDDVAFFRNGISQGGINPIVFDLMVETPFSFSDFPSGVTNTGNSETTTTATTAATSNSAERLNMTITDSFLRGEATLLQCDVPQSIDCRVKNSLVALAKSFVQTEDTKRTTPQDSAVRIRLERSTFFGSFPFVRQIRNSFTTEPMKLEIGSWNSIFFLNHLPLAIFRGAPSSQSAFDYFKWTGESNYFQNVTLGWKFTPALSASGGGTTYDMPIAEWKEKMNPVAENNAQLMTKIDVLKFDEIRKPIHQLLPEDLKFRSDSRITDTEKESAGFPADTLNWLPSSWTNNAN
ncbi:MAG: serine/threonine protein kinase [Planctomycetaceae bacterium]|jgi:serine/threonine protein kinase|nr:serine/threonine protein kinase [Planctomycetaceae bacterium]